MEEEDKEEDKDDYFSENKEDEYTAEICYS